MKQITKNGEYGMESKWKGMENFFLNPLEFKLYGMEWNWNGNGMEISPQKKSMQNGMEMEWNWNGNGMEINGHPALKVKLNGNGMETLWRTVILTLGFGNGMEWKWKWNSLLFVLNFHTEKL